MIHPHRSRRPARKHESGQAIVFLVLVLLGLLGFAALALDGGNLYTEQRRAQAAADHAVMAAAFTYMQDGSASETDLRSAALTHAASNAYSNDGATNWVEFYWPPQHGALAGNNSYIEVMITQTVPTALAHLIYRQSPIPLTVFAVADATPSGPTMPGYAIVSFHIGCTGNEFTPRGNGFSIIKDGGVFVNSDPTVPNCDESIKVSGSNGRLATTTSADCPDDSTQATCVINGAFPINVGGVQLNGITCTPPPAIDWWTGPGDNVSTDCNFYPAPTQNFDQILDPPAPLSVDDFTCDPTNRDSTIIGSSPISLQPGSYSTLNANGKTLHLQPGIYCITGRGPADKIMDAASIIGRGVFIYIADPQAEFKFTGGDLVLTAPFHDENGLTCMLPTDDPAYNPLCAVEGAVLFKPVGPDSCSPSNGDIDFSGQGNMIIRGLIWAPESLMTFTGQGNVYMIGQALVGCVKYAGLGEVDVTYSPDETFSPPPRIRLDE